MYQEVSAISPSRRQVENYLEISQPVGDTSFISALNQSSSASRASSEFNVIL